MALLLQVFRAVIIAMGSMGSVTMVCVLCLLIFAIMGTHLFGGRFARCNDDAVSNVQECTGTFVDPVTGATIGEEWLWQDSAAGLIIIGLRIAYVDMP